jgi:hypothetical protein
MCLDALVVHPSLARRLLQRTVVTWDSCDLMEELNGSTSDWHSHPCRTPPGSSLEVGTLWFAFLVEAQTGSKAPEANLRSTV